MKQVFGNFLSKLSGDYNMMQVNMFFKIFTLILGAFSYVCASAGELSGITAVQTGQHTKLELTLNEEGAPEVFFLNQGHPRVVIDIKNARLSQTLAQKSAQGHKFGGAGDIKQIRYAVRSGSGLRIVADLARKAKYEGHSYENGVLNVSVSSGFISKPISGVVFPRLKPIGRMRYADGIPVPVLKKRQLTVKKRKPLIVIDPGHGGRDPGASGRAKVREKTITLSAAHELRKQLLKTGKYNVALTRSTDKYIAHEMRVRIARKAGADLFISLHADSLANPSTRGASVYTLADRAHKRGQRLVDTQNWILDVDLAKQTAPVSDILVDLAQRKTLSKSGEFADVLVAQLEPRTILLRNTHREAGYFVLLAPDVPAVLFEMGFLSNARDEKLLNSAKHRKKIMTGVTKAIGKYFSAQTTLHASN